jgi:hypothetical protein
MQRSSMHRGLAICGLAAFVLLAACRDEREVIFYEPHVYKGESDLQLSQGTVKELEDRAQQGGRL